MHMSKQRSGRAPPLLRGRRCAPDRRIRLGQRLPLFTASPYGPAGTSHRRGSPSRSLNGGSLTFAHPDLLLACGPRVEREPLGFFPELRTPQSPATHVRAETGHHALARVLHLRHQPNLTRCLPLRSSALMSHIVTGGLHHHARHLLLGQHVGQPQDHRRCGRPGGYRRRRFPAATSSEPNAHLRVGLRDVEPRAAGMHDFHDCLLHTPEQ